MFEIVICFLFADFLISMLLLYIYIYIRNFVSIHGGSIIVVNIIFRCMNVWRFWGFEANHSDIYTLNISMLLYECLRS